MTSACLNEIYMVAMFSLARLSFQSTRMSSAGYTIRPTHHTVFVTKGPYTLTSFLVPVAGASQLAPVNRRVCHVTGTRISLVPVGFNTAHVLFVCRQLTPETGTGYWYQKTGQCVWPFSYECQCVWPLRHD